MQLNNRNILKPKGMLYNAMSLTRPFQDHIQQYNLFNHKHIVSTKFTFIFSLSPCIIQGNDTCTVKDQKEVMCTLNSASQGHPIRR